MREDRRKRYDDEFRREALGLKCRIRAANPWRKYSSYRGGDGERVPNLLKRDFRADRPFAKLGTDVTEFKVAGAKAYLAPVYDMAGKEIIDRKSVV